MAKIALLISQHYCVDFCKIFVFFQILNCTFALRKNKKTEQNPAFSCATEITFLRSWRFDGSEIHNQNFYVQRYK